MWYEMVFGCEKLINLNQENACKIPQSHLNLFGDNYKPICAIAYINTLKLSRNKWYKLDIIHPWLSSEL